MHPTHRNCHRNLSRLQPREITNPGLMDSLGCTKASRKAIRERWPRILSRTMQGIRGRADDGGLGSCLAPAGDKMTPRSSPVMDNGARVPSEGLRNPATSDRRKLLRRSFLSRPGIHTMGVALLICIAMLRIVSTYYVFNHTIDEPAHVACGMQWLQNHVYTYESLHPPIARVSVALLPYLAGLRGTGAPSMWQEGLLI